MTNLRRRVFALFTIATVLFCTAVGAWQLHRLEWKRGLIAERAAAAAASPIAPPQTLAEARLLEFRRVVAEGVFLHDRELFLNASGPNGGAGFDVLTPLRETGGRIVFVNRGFVLTALRDRAKRPSSQPAGAVQVTGRLRLPPDKKPGWFLPDNNPERNYWFWIDLPAMAAAAGVAAGVTPGVSEVAPFHIEADTAATPGGWPRSRVTSQPLSNDHLQYAITWFSFAGAALIIFVLSQRQTKAAKRDLG